MPDGSLTALMSAGADAFTNLWDVKFELPNKVTSGGGRVNDVNHWSIRISDFKPIEPKPSTYPTDYKGVQLSRMSAKLEFERTLEFSIRVDASYDVVADLKAWKHIWFDPSGDGNIRFGMFNDAISNPDEYGTITVSGYTSDASTTLGGLAGGVDDNGAGTTGIQYIYKDVVCVTSGEPNFSRSESGAVTVNATFIFGRYIEPFSGGEGTATSTTSPSDIPALTP